MNMLNRFLRHAALIAGVLLLGTGLAAHADDIQDAHKLFKQGQHDSAMEKVNGVLSSKPKDAQARFLKGLILTEQNNTADAIKIFTGLTEDYPELPEPYNNLAVLYASQGQYDKAKQSLEMAIRTHPSYATAHENLGDIYAKMASQAYDRALQLDRGNTATQTKLAMIQDLFSAKARPKSNAGRNPTPALPIGVGNLPPAPSAPAPVKVNTVAAAAVSAPVVATPVATTPVVTAPAAATKPAAAKPDAEDKNSDVLKTVDAWAAAWESKNVKKYLAFYANDFQVPGHASRAKWEAERQERISKPKSIQVGISKATVKFSDATHATVKFHQSYHAGHLKISGNKTLLMVKSGGKWLIQEERAK